MVKYCCAFLKKCLSIKWHNVLEKYFVKYSKQCKITLWFIEHFSNLWLINDWRIFKGKTQFLTHACNIKKIKFHSSALLSKLPFLTSTLLHLLLMFEQKMLSIHYQSIILTYCSNWVCSSFSFGAEHRYNYFKINYKRTWIMMVSIVSIKNKSQTCRSKGKIFHKVLSRKY